jgi:hypothetical protein
VHRRSENTRRGEEPLEVVAGCGTPEAVPVYRPHLRVLDDIFRRKSHRRGVPHCGSINRLGYRAAVSATLTITAVAVSGAIRAAVLDRRAQCGGPRGGEHADRATPRSIAGAASILRAGAHSRVDFQGAS